MLRLRERPTPDSGSLEARYRGSWPEAGDTDEGFLRDEALYRDFEGGLN